MANYLYNGVELPALPDWDKETYPYALVYLDINKNCYYLVCVLEELVTESGFFADLEINLPYDPTATSGQDWGLRYALNDTWEAVTGTNTIRLVDANGNEQDRAIWANHDILNSDGTLYLAASDPIPVSNPPAPDPFWMTMGWLVGRMIAGMRNKRKEETQ